MAVAFCSAQRSLKGSSSSDASPSAAASARRRARRAVGVVSVGLKSECFAHDVRRFGEFGHSLGSALRLASASFKASTCDLLGCVASTSSDSKSLDRWRIMRTKASKSTTAMTSRKTARAVASRGPTPFAFACFESQAQKRASSRAELQPTSFRTWSVVCAANLWYAWKHSNSPSPNSPTRPFSSSAPKRVELASTKSAMGCHPCSRNSRKAHAHTSVISSSTMPEATGSARHR
mmetsp:Transcript_11623/g.38864  ORF Transcript_11623/g.38864 Transcript_11623/m.38864 type:complete len:234 (+) Transcript_11623:175-876(+)